MNSYLFAIMAVAAYFLGAVIIFKAYFKERSKSIALALAVMATAFHTLFIASTILQASTFNFSFFSMASLISMIVALVLTITSLKRPLENLGILIFPLAASMLALDLIFTEKQRSLDVYNWEMTFHILTSIIAFSLLNIAALQAILLIIQNQQLKSHPPKHYLKSLPSLESMEALLFQMITAGLLFLSLSLSSGFIFLEDIFAQHLAHKTFLSIAAWLIFSILLLGRQRYGWRGITAIKWTLAGFVFLLLAYFGSKLVMEIILKR